jgi:carboxypeptidase Taq
MMPPAGAETRAEQSATLVRVRHERLTSDELGSLLDRLGDWAGRRPYESDEASLVRAARREWEKARRVPVELRGEIARSASLAETAWEGARRDSDFAAFRPHLERNLELAHRYAECFEGFEDVGSAYDALLDDYEPGMRTGEMRALLGALRDGLRPLLDLVMGAEQVDDSPLYGRFPLQAQRELMREVGAGMPLDPGGWRLDESAHPFSTSIGEGDLRITTRYDESYIGTALWSMLHEVGHAIYEAGADPDLRRTPIGHPVSLGFHESQSRLWENWVGRSRPYIDWLHPRLAQAFPQALDGASPEHLYRAANRVRPSLIRVEADELTYNLHGLVPRDGGARRCARRAPGRALGRGRLRLLPHLLARQRDRGSALGARPRRAPRSRRPDQGRGAGAAPRMAAAASPPPWGQVHAQGAGRPRTRRRLRRRPAGAPPRTQVGPGLRGTRGKLAWAA